MPFAWHEQFHPCLPIFHLLSAWHHGDQGGDMRSDSPPYLPVGFFPRLSPLGTGMGDAYAKGIRIAAAAPGTRRL